jgi:DNA-binding beta-propeller fold protein YncE
MTESYWRRANAIRLARRTPHAALLLAIVAVAMGIAPAARANVGYELDAAHPSRALPGPPKGIAVDPATQDIYVAIVSRNPNTGVPGEVDRFNSDLTADGVFAQGGGFYTGVAIKPGTQDFYAAQMELHTALGNFGTPRLDRFLSTGASAGSFALGFTDSLPPIVTDAAGRIYFPNVNTHSVQVFNSTGTLLENITCSGCPGGTFGKPGSVALNAAGDLYVADTAPDRVIKLTSSGGAYSYASTLQSGRGAGAVAVDPGTGDILVGDMPGGDNYHIVAYDSSGTQFDDFGAGLFRNASSGGYGALSAYQIAVNATTHKLYVGEYDKFYAFERKATIALPSATAEPATNRGQLTATMTAKANANGHAVLECEFELTDDADTGFADATSMPCPKKPVGTTSTSLNVPVSGLAPGTAYRYRVIATSNAGSVTSNSRTFETLPLTLPTVTTESPQAVGQTAATLVGSVNPHGGAVSDCHFELGTSIVYGSDLPCPTLPGPLTTNVVETKGASGLLPGTAYHYRLLVTTNAGTSEGEDVAFTTATPPAGGEPSPDPGSAVPPPALPPVTPPETTPHPPQCGKGFRRQRVNGKPRCVKICKRGFRRKQVRGKVRCVPKRRSSRPRRGRAGN